MSRVIHIFSLDGKNSIEVDYTETPEQTKEQDGKTYYFYNYGSKIWANVKCQANGAISYWTWIPRYAYKLESGTTKVIRVCMEIHYQKDIQYMKHLNSKMA